jgi:hypothetical protein
VVFWTFLTAVRGGRIAIIEIWYEVSSIKCLQCFLHNLAALLTILQDDLTNEPTTSEMSRVETLQTCHHRNWNLNGRFAKTSDELLRDKFWHISLNIFKFIPRSHRPFAASRYRSLSQCMSWNWNIFTRTNTFEHAEFKSEKFPLRRPCVFLQTAILSSLISWQIFSLFNDTNEWWHTIMSAQKDQFLLTILLFNKRSFRSNHVESCNLMHVGSKQHILFTTLGRYR